MTLQYGLNGSPHRYATREDDVGAPRRVACIGLHVADTLWCWRLGGI